MNGEESASSDDEPVDNSDDGSDLSSGDELLDERTSAVRIVRRRTATGANQTVGSSRPSSISRTARLPPNDTIQNDNPRDRRVAFGSFVLRDGMTIRSPNHATVLVVLFGVA